MLPQQQLGHQQEQNLRPKVCVVYKNSVIVADFKQRQLLFRIGRTPIPYKNPFFGSYKNFLSNKLYVFLAPRK